LKGPRRRHAPAALETRDDGLGGLHAPCHLLLCEVCAGANFDQRGGKRKALFQRFIFEPEIRVLHPLLVEIVNGCAFH
jgi:hypothetical protein